MHLNAAALQYVPPSFRSDRGVALAAVQRDGLALQHATLQLRADMEVVHAAVMQNGLALQHASQDLRSNHDIAVAAAQQNSLALQYMPPRMRSEFLRASAPEFGHDDFGGEMFGNRYAGMQYLRTRPGVAVSSVRPLHASALAATTAVFTVNDQGVGVGKGSNGDPSVEQCMVCLEAFQTGDELRVLPCVHRFHRACVDTWLRRSVECPICKHRIDRR